MTMASELAKEFTEFKAQVESRFDNFTFLEEDNFKKILRDVVRSEEREKLLNKILLAIVSFGITTVLLAGFVLFILLFTVPV